MANFQRLLESFREGALSREEFFRGVDRILGSGLEDPVKMLNMLQGVAIVQGTRSADVFQEVRNRIETAIKGGVHSHAHDEVEVDSATRLATSLMPENVAVDSDEFEDPSRTRLAVRRPKKKNVPAAEQSYTRIASGLNEPDSPGLGSSGSARADVEAQANILQADNDSEPVKGSGDVINDRFVLQECLGSGGMSTVYKALDRRKLEANDRHPYVAVKILNVEFRSHPDSLIALQREAKKSQSLAHPNIVRVYDFDRDGSTVYMTMEYLVGTSLAQKLKTPNFKGMPHDPAMRILKRMARALSFAHENGIVHADFKPANVILTTGGGVKVIDFGIARAFHRPDETDIEATRFDPGSLCALTPAYASPEMLEQCEPDPRDDVYALACITYEMFTGNHPFSRMPATEARDAGLEIVRDETITRRQHKALKAALAFDRRQRTATVERFLNDIRPRRIVKPALAAALALLAVSAGGTGYYLMKPGMVPVMFSQQADESIEQASLETLQVAHSDDTLGNTRVNSPEGPLTKASGNVKSDNETISGAETVALLSESAGAGQIALLEKPLTTAAVMHVIERLPCAALNAYVDNGNVDVHGFASMELDARRLETDLAALPGAGRITSSIKRVSTDNCRVIELLAPYWVANHSMDQGTSVKTRSKTGRLTAGAPLVVDITTPSYTSYINVDYFLLDGGVFHMSPSPRSNVSQVQADYAAALGEDGQWLVTEPYGTEMVVVLVTPQPLFELPRREYEAGSDYLSELQLRLQSMADKFDKNKITADFAFIETSSKMLIRR